MSEKRFDELWDWQEAEDLAQEIYRVVNKFPSEEKYNLISQLRSAAVSVFSNIAEGCGRGTDKDYVRFLINARGSTQEILAQLHFAETMNYISEEEYKMFYQRYNKLAAAINNHINFLRSKKK
jgi:four helix bundle protein